MLSVKQGSIKYHFLSLWYDLTRDWTQVSQAIGEHCNYHANVHTVSLINKYIPTNFYEILFSSKPKMLIFYYF